MKEKEICTNLSLQNIKKNWVVKIDGKSLKHGDFIYGVEGKNIIRGYCVWPTNNKLHSTYIFHSHPITLPSFSQHRRYYEIIKTS